METTTKNDTTADNVRVGSSDLLGEWINTYNSGTKRGWGVWPTREAAIKALSVYPIPAGDTYSSTIPLCEWCA